jgi:hypothetical protein
MNQSPVASNRKIVANNSDHADGGITEVFDLGSKTHRIRFTRRPDQWAQYKDLDDVGIVLPPMDLHIDEPEDFEMIIPTGSVPTSSQLEMIARNVDSYSEVLFVVGAYLGEIHSKTGLVPTATSGRDILDSILLYNDPSLDKGVGALLAPPFYLESQKGTKKLRKLISSELTASTVFSDEKVQSLMTALQLGIEVGKDEQRS